MAISSLGCLPLPLRKPSGDECGRKKIDGAKVEGEVLGGVESTPGSHHEPLEVSGGDITAAERHKLADDVVGPDFQFLALVPGPIRAAGDLIEAGLGEIVEVVETLAAANCEGEMPPVKVVKA